MDNWCGELGNLVNFAETQPHAAYAAYIYGFVHKLSFLSRTLPGIGPLLQPIDNIVSLEFIPKLTGRPPGSSAERNILALPARHGGLGLRHLAHSSDWDFNASCQVADPLVSNIDSKNETYYEEILAAQHMAKSSISRTKREDFSSKAEAIKANLPPQLKLAMTLASEKGASSWLTTLPLVEFGLSLHKGGFRDALCLRYGWQPSGIPTSCCCGSPFSVDHALSCPRGGFPTIRHNEVRDTFASWMSEICSGVTTEPYLQTLTSESLGGATAIRGDEARLDIVADGLWGGRRERTYFDVRVVNPYARSNRLESLPALYCRHEKMKRRAYDQRVREVEHATFVPLVFSLTGGAGISAAACLKRLASGLSDKWDQPYSQTIGWLRAKLSFALLRSSIYCIRGARTTHNLIRNPESQQPLDLIINEAKILF